MKKMKNLLLVLLCIISSTAVAQTPVKEVEATVKEGNVVSLRIPQEVAATNIKLVDLNKNELYSKKISGVDFKKNFSFDVVPQGDYLFTIESDTKVVEVKLQKKEEVVIVVGQKNIFKPNLRALEKNDQLVRLTFKNPNPGRANVKVYDKFGNLIIKLSNDQTFFNKVFDFSEAPAGEYSIAISTVENEFLKKVMINK